VLITTSGAVHSSVFATLPKTGGVLPPKTIPALDGDPVPEPKPLLAVAKSFTSVQDVPFQNSVLPVPSSDVGPEIYITSSTTN
jgi:hypothetical protein